MSVSTHPTENRESNSQSKSGPNARLGLLRNGLVGGAVAVLLSFLPLSTVLGGGVAGYLDRGAGRLGAGAGTVAGIVASLPYVLVGVYLALSPAVTLPGPDLALSPVIVVAGTTAFAVVYVVGLSVLGGLIGGYIQETEVFSQ
ncbi:hypothetical protein AArcSl_0219 [Halalkaliarchaeum desulfuricum]|uniref:DUF5518 domain-containing protein n=1 Tax=Halalkaliarchaeum desulfuricum TaxID=2055893 RepID=A0A343TFK2_9EURY|nr:DUF5518 domain-containing protein [Halalkaliarchaeum desulfuricum]AUX07874.1 hypothetical protein AArcSl_0219 [Halalkaliarchaeum desulfuricum]